MLVRQSTGLKVHADFWRDFFDAYFDQFQWNLPYDRDPDPSFPPPPDETPEVMKEKEQTIEAIKEVSLLGRLIDSIRLI